MACVPSRSAILSGFTVALALGLGTSASAGPHHDHDRPKARSAQVAGVSTLERTLVGGDPSQSFQFLRPGAGEPYVVREDLAAAQAGRDQRRRSLIYLAQLSDFQISDEESPARVEFLDRDPSGFASSAWRPQETLVAQQVEQTIRQVNRFLDSPVTQGDGSRARLANAVVTGDQADNQQLNETELVLRLLEGGSADPASGTQDLAHPLCPPSGALVRDFADPRRYTGVQDYSDYPAGDSIFYDPADVRGVYAERGWPRYPGLLDRAQEPFRAEGLKVPSYVAFGNHDALVQGNQAANASFELISTGCVKPLTSLDPPRDPAALLGRALAEPDKFMLVPRDARRTFLDKVEYKELHRTDRQSDAHGFALVDPEELRASNGAASYYSFEPTDGLRYVVLDTVCEGGVAGQASNGTLDDPQFRWLERELDGAQRRGELIVVFGHHATGSLSCGVPDEAAPPCVAEGDVNPGCDRDPRVSTPLHGGEDLRDLLLRFDHTIALVAGHSHESRVQALGTRERGLWEIKSPAVVDWPTQHRLIEVMDNRDGTLSLFGTMLDHAAPATAPPGRAAGEAAPVDLSFDALGALGRTLAYNDPQVGPGPSSENSGEPGGQQDATAAGPRGRRIDRNVELVLRDPRARAAQEQGGAPAAGRTDAPASQPARDGDDDTGAVTPARERSTRTSGSVPAGDGGPLPFTGGDVLWLAALGAALLAAGVGLRSVRAARRH